MTGSVRRLAAVLASAMALAGADVQPSLDFAPPELRRVLQHGPWPPPVSRDASNRVSGDPRAVALGQRLFFDPRLSANRAIACATCPSGPGPTAGRGRWGSTGWTATRRPCWTPACIAASRGMVGPTACGRRA